MSDAYRVWEPLNEHEDDGLEVLADSATFAALEYGEAVVNSGDADGLRRQTVRARNLCTRELHEIDLDFEYLPSAITRGAARLIE